MTHNWTIDETTEPEQLNWTDPSNANPLMYFAGLWLNVW